MGVSIQQAAGNIIELQITGVLKKSELDALQSTGKMFLAAVDNVRVILRAEDFVGWEKGADWNDMSFFVNFGDKIERIAIVSNPILETQWLMFVGAGFRRAAVKFFASGQADAARTWIAS
jgi:hypothetical protein